MNTTTTTSTTEAAKAITITAITSAVGTATPLPADLLEHLLHHLTWTTRHLAHRIGAPR